MSFDATDDILQVKRYSEITLDGMMLGTPYDHFRVLVYRLDPGGVQTLVYTSEAFTSIPIVLTVGAVNDSAAFEFDAEDNTYYRLSVVQYDSGETISAEEDEHFIHIFPDAVETEEDADNNVSSSKFENLLHMLGHNVLDGEFRADAGYTQERVRRGYVEDMTDDEAATRLAASADPADIGIDFKSKAILTTSDHGNEVASLETEQTIT